MSDQDFFFDEDEAPAQESSKTSGTKKAKAAAPAVAPMAAQSVTMTVAALFSVVTLLVGLIGGVFIGRSLAGSGATASPAGVNVPAPQLSPEQMQSGSLPEGHPDIGAMGGGAPAPGAEGEDAQPEGEKAAGDDAEKPAGDDAEKPAE